MKASLPRRMTLPAIEAAVITLGYGPKREPFDLVAFTGLHNGKRFHMRLETHGLDRVPKGSEIDLHMDFFREVKGFHGSEAESPELAFEMARLLGALNDQDPERTRPRVRCPDCGKEFGQEAFGAHRKVGHGYQRRSRLNARRPPVRNPSSVQNAAAPAFFCTTSTS